MIKPAIVFALLIITFTFKVLYSQVNAAAQNKNSSGNNEILTEENIKLTEEYLRASIKTNPDPELLFALAELCIYKNTISGRAEARELLTRAIIKAPKKLEYRFMLAEIFLKISIGMACEIYKDILEIDSTSWEAHYYLGVIEENEFVKYLNSIAMYGDDRETTLDPEKYENENFKNAESNFTSAIRYDYLNKDTYMHLGYLYEDNNEPGKAILILKSLEQIYPADPDVHLFLGLLYYKSAQMDKSNSEYKQAFALLPDSSKEDFTVNSVKGLLRPFVGGGLEKMTHEELEKEINAYWKVINPLYIADYNLALLEHYSLVAYANLRFTQQNKNNSASSSLLAGWNTPQGETILQDGFPQNQNDSLAVKLEGPEINVPFEIVQFRNDDHNYTDVYVNYAIELKDSLVKANNNYYSYKWGLFFFDTLFNSIVEKTGNVNNINSELRINLNPGNDFAAGSLKMNIYPEPGSIEFEIERNIDKGVSSNHFEFNPIEFNMYEPDISNIVLALEVKYDKPNSLPFNRGRISLLPNPMGTFSAQQPIYVYYELYNFSHDTNGFTDIEQKLIFKENNQGSKITSAISSVLRAVGLSKKHEEINKVTLYKIAEMNPRINFQFDALNCLPGDYILTLVVTDKLTGKQVEEEVPLTLQ
jgi:GWxTD domain-containing protein